MAVDAQGRRATAYRAFLNKDVALVRKERLKVCTGVIASKLDIDGAAGVVKGVFFRSASSKNGGRAGGSSDFYAHARRDVIVCSGAMATPQLLMLRYVTDTLPHPVYDPGS
jgi:choline dehydrogenase-like flavoprotein